MANLTMMANWIMISYKLVNLNLVKSISHSENSITFEIDSGQEVILFNNTEDAEREFEKLKKMLINTNRKIPLNGWLNLYKNTLTYD